MASEKSAEASTITSLNARGDRHPLAGAKMTGAEIDAALALAAAWSPAERR